MRNEPITVSLVLIHDGGRLLLGRRKRGPDRGRWGHFGGRVMPGETADQAARREFREDTGVAVTDLVSVGQLSFTYADGRPEMEIQIFSTGKPDAEIGETEKILPAWFDADRLPFDKMWADDRHWLPLFLGGKRFVGSFHCGEGQTILYQSLITIDGCPVCGGLEPRHVKKVRGARCEVRRLA